MFKADIKFGMWVGKVPLGRRTTSNEEVSIGTQNSQNTVGHSVWCWPVWESPYFMCDLLLIL